MANGQKGTGPFLALRRLAILLRSLLERERKRIRVDRVIEVDAEDAASVAFLKGLFAEDAHPEQAHQRGQRDAA